ncbi:hypothetical protein D9M69_468750 [compost metagenome]
MVFSGNREKSTTMSARSAGAIRTLSWFRIGVGSRLPSLAIWVYGYTMVPPVFCSTNS